MPFTPFHFGPGASIHAGAPTRISFLAFCAANVLIDVEPLYFMATNNPPLHRFFHTFIGATLVALTTAAVFVACKRFDTRNWLPTFFGWKSLRLPAVVAGAACGTYTHILLDSIMHSDIQPLSPFSNANPLLHLVPLAELHLFCVASGVFGGVVLAVRHMLPGSGNAG